MVPYGNINDIEKELTEDQERMRRNLRYHFMNPKEKWQAKGTLPIKMIIIVVKLLILTIQLILFSQNNSNEVSFVEGSKTSFKHLFLHSWESSFETLPYPPSSGPFAIYKTDQFYTYASFALENYYKLEDQAIGSYGYCDDGKPIMNLTVYYYYIKEIFPFNSTYYFNNSVKHRTIELKPITTNNKTVYDVKTYLEQKNFTINMKGLLKADIAFSLRSIQLKSYEMDQIPDCFQFDIIITFNNEKHNGQIIVDLSSHMTERVCYGNKEMTNNGMIINRLLITIDVFSLIFSLVSLSLCIRSKIRLYKFWKKTKQFFMYEMNLDISNKRKHFISISYTLIFIGDILIIIGTIIKLNMYDISLRKSITSFTICTYFLGIGVFTGYLSLLRYFSYFPKSSILINTIRAATPPLLRFSLCSVILYLAFSFLGWVILGPYHLKFRTLISSISCLFSLMNGDDMYVTLSIINTNNPVVFVFSQIFIYFFCLLFIFVVLNLILTIIIEAYTQVQKQDSYFTYADDFWNFINSCPESSQSPLYKSDLIYDKSLRKQGAANFSRKFVDTLCCCIGKGGHTVEIKVDHDNDNEEPLSSNFFGGNDYQEIQSQTLYTRPHHSRVNYGSIYHERRHSPNHLDIPRISPKGRDIACSF